MATYSVVHPAAASTVTDRAGVGTLIRPLLIAGATAAILILATFNLGRYPTIWFDEGSHLHVPKALVEQGVYADTSAEGFRYFGPTTGIGPTVMLPIAAAFKLAGVGLVQARLVMVGYLMFALLTFTLAARRLHGGRTAWLAVALLLAAPGVNFLFVGRQVLGEVPALAFMMLGVFFWTRSVDRSAHRWLDLFWASIAFGLMALTKNQFALILAPSLALFFLVDRVYYRSLNLAQGILPFLFVVAGTALGQLVPLLPLLTSDQLGPTLALLRGASSGAIFVFAPDRILSSLKLILSADAFAYLAVPGLVYGLVLARPRDVSGARHGFLLIFALVGLAWYALGSIGWPRYAFPALAVTALFVARLLIDLIQSERRMAGGPGRWRAVALTSFIGVLLVSSLMAQVRDIAGTRDESAQQMTAYIDESVPHGAVIETWEPELGFLSDAAYHYPPSGWLDRAVRAQWLTKGGLPDYDPRDEVSPSYLIVGKFGKYTGIYAPLLKRERPQLVATIGDYDLYWLQPHQ
jgi:hypothetical protein